MNSQIRYIEYLKKLVTRLNLIIKKYETSKVDLTDDDKETIKATIETFLRTEKQL